MDILIKGMKMKDYPQSITINPDGSVIKDTFGLHRPMEEWKAVTLPEHGDLKDANAILRWLNAKADNRVPVTVGEIIDFIEKQPIVLEANND